MMGQREKFTAVSFSEPASDVSINYVVQVENCDDVAVEDDIPLERTAFYGLKAKDGLSRCLDF
jgi:hypothetical protein